MTDPTTTPGLLEQDLPELEFLDGPSTDGDPRLVRVDAERPLVSAEPVALGDEVPFFETYRAKPEAILRFVTSGPEGMRVRFYVEREPREPFSAGHYHGSAYEQDAIGSCTPSEITLPAGYPQNVQMEFRAPGGSGVLRYSAAFANGNVITHRIEVLVEGLVPIAASDQLRLKPPTERHPSPYWVTPAMNEKLVALADRYAAERGKHITVTDASLVWGGRFDLNGDWNRPHAEHRDGNQADIRSFDMTDEDKAAFRRICRDIRLGVYVEADHWHVRG